MQDRIDYLIKNNLCEKAIEDFERNTSIHNWLSKYEDLYNSITIQPDNLPKITLSNFQGERFEKILRFSQLYNEVNSLY